MIVMAQATAWIRVLGLLLLAGAGGACASYSDVRFVPPIQDTDLRGDANDIQAHVVVAWRGIEERDDVPELRFRVRVDNPGPAAFTLVPAEFELLDAALVSLGQASPGAVAVVEPGQSSTFDIAFPVASSLDDFDLSAITLRTRFQGQRWSWSNTFERVLHHDDGPPVSFGVGVGVGL
jgi:hypothetical protein